MPEYLGGCGFNKYENIRAFSLISGIDRTREDSGRECCEAGNHWNIEGRRNFGKSVNAGHSSRGPERRKRGEGRGRRGCGGGGRATIASAPRPHCNRCSHALARCAYIRNHANVTRMWCSWRLVPCRWHLLQPRPVRARPVSILDRHRPP